MDTIDLHYSDLHNWRMCKRKFFFSGTPTHGLTSNVPDLATLKGTLFHASLEQFYRHGIYPIDGIQTYLDTHVFDGDYRDVVEKATEVATGMAGHYYEWAGAYYDHLADYNLDVLDMEVGWKLANFMPGVNLAGTWDGVMRHKDTGKYYIWECKTAWDIYDRHSYTNFDEQAWLYTFAGGHIFGDNFGGIIYQFAKSSNPPDVKVLKNGSLSKNKMGKTPDWFIYQGKKHGYKELTLLEEYADFIDTLEMNEVSPYFLRSLMNFPDEFITDYISDLTREVKTIQDALRFERFPMCGNGYVCSKCRFKRVCTDWKTFDTAADDEYHRRTHVDVTYEKDLDD